MVEHNKEKIKAYNKKYYAENKEKLLANMKNHYQETKEQHKQYYLKNKDKINKRMNSYMKETYRPTHKKQILTIQKICLKRIRMKRREQILQLLGNKCIRCGFLDKRALQIDHIHGRGLREMKEMKGNASPQYLKNILKHPEDYQILCANCNWIKRVENNEVGYAGDSYGKRRD